MATIDPIDAQPPTSEIGHSGGMYGVGMGSGTNHILMDTEAEVRALAWPYSIGTYDKMRRDAQIAALYNGVTIPIRKYPWSIDPNGARDEVVANFAQDFGLPIVGEAPDTPIGRRRNRFNHDDHLQHALLSMLYGMMFMEQYGEYDESTRGNTGNLAVDHPLWRLLKLAPRMPKTISQIEVARDGGLVSIKQYGVARPGQIENKAIPVEQLVAYIWNKEGANWFGRSLLMAIYRDWLIKDRLLRVDAIKHERTGAGVPIIEAPPGASQVEIMRLDAMAQRYKVGESSGGAVPANARFRLVGVEGATSDVLASIRYHDEQMSLNFFSEVKTLGHTAYGSRALGDTFAPFLVDAQESIAEWYARITNEHVIEDWVDWNYGSDENAPRLVWEDPNAAQVQVGPDGKPLNVADQPANDQMTLAASRKALAGVDEVLGLRDIGVLNLAPEQSEELDAFVAYHKSVIANAGRPKRWWRK